VHIWSLDGEKNIMSAHVIVDKDLNDLHIVKEDIRHVLEHL
jgi:Co/Zn/Cd efflux system component